MFGTQLHNIHKFVDNLLERNRGDDHGLYGAVIAACWGRLYRFDNLHTRHHLAKDGVLGIEKVVGSRVDEELRAVGVWAGVGHGDSADVVAVAGAYLVGKLVTRPACPPPGGHGVVFAQRVAALDHKALDDAVELGPVIKAGLRKFDKIGDRFGRAGSKLDDDVALGGV